MLCDPRIRTSQIEVVHHMGYRRCDMESNFFLAQPARWELFAANRNHFMLRTMRFIDSGVYAGYRYNLSRPVSLWFAVVGKLHDLTCAVELSHYAQKACHTLPACNSYRSLPLSLTRSADGSPRFPCTLTPPL